MNKKLMITRPELHPVPVKSAWYHIGMDFVGPIHPMTHNGNQFILTINFVIISPNLYGQRLCQLKKQ